MKRRHNPSIPAHIDQDKIPARLYFDARKGAGRWYMLTRDAAGKQQRKDVASRDARLSDLHAIAEAAAGVDRHSVRYLCEEFEKSTQFAELLPTTRADYKYCHGVVVSFRSAKLGLLGDMAVSKLSPPTLQAIIDKMATTGPSKAAHALRYLRRLFKWGVQRGHCADNAARGVEQPTERKLRRLPDPVVMAAVVRYAFARGAVKARATGACPSYLWAVMDIAYLCRLRGIEVVTMTDAHALEEGVMTNRRKGSRDNIVRWTPRLRAAWQTLEVRRAAIWTAQSAPIPMRPENRPLVISEDGTALKKSGLNTAWQRFIRDAIKDGVLTTDQRFSLHDLKRRGITDTAGTRADKQEASGHRTAAMLDVYDLSVPVVDPSQL